MIPGIRYQQKKLNQFTLDQTYSMSSPQCTQFRHNLDQKCFCCCHSCSPPPPHNWDPIVTVSLSVDPARVWWELRAQFSCACHRSGSIPCYPSLLLLCKPTNQPTKPRMVALLCYTPTITLHTKMAGITTLHWLASTGRTFPLYRKNKTKWIEPSLIFRLSSQGAIFFSQKSLMA